MTVCGNACKQEMVVTVTPSDCRALTMTPEFYNDWMKNQPTHLYLVDDGENYKIGISKNPEKRIKQVESARGKRVRTVLIERLRQPRFVEYELKKIFSGLCTGGEWFNYDYKEIEYIRYVCDKTRYIDGDKTIKESEKRIAWLDAPEYILRGNAYKTEMGMVEFGMFSGSMIFTEHLRKEQYAHLPTSQLVAMINAFN